MSKMSDRANEIELEKDFSPYGPVRYKKLFFWNFAYQMARHGSVVKDGRVTADAHDDIFEQLIKPAIELSFNGATQEDIDNADTATTLAMTGAAILGLSEWVPLICQYILSGDQIFDLSDNLVDMLNHTDLGDCTLESWHAPYNSFFIRFGKQDAALADFDRDDNGNIISEFVDGAFVSTVEWDSPPSDKKRIKIGLTTVKNDGSSVMLPGHLIDFTPDEQKMPLKEALDAACERNINKIRNSADDNQLLKFTSECRVGNVEEFKKIASPILSLIINSLFYIESIKGTEAENKFSPGRDVPPDLVASWMNASPEKRVKLRKKINSDGYTIVRLVGSEIKDHQSNTGTGNKRTHWRRGHWRNQQHGANKSLVKRIWIKPTMINPTEDGMVDHGRIYVADSNTAH